MSRPRNAPRSNSGNRPESVGQAVEGGGQLGRADDLEIRVEAGHGGGEADPRPRAEGQPAAVAAEFLDDAVAGVAGDGGGRQPEEDRSLTGPVAGGVGG